jgi:hypothetical protein
MTHSEQKIAEEFEGDEQLIKNGIFIFTIKEWKHTP